MTLPDFLKFREIFNEILQSKTGWGRVEVLRAFDEAARKFAETEQPK